MKIPLILIFDIEKFLAGLNKRSSTKNVLSEKIPDNRCYQKLQLN